MASLTVRNLDKKLILALKKLAQKNGVTQQEECRRIFERAVQPAKKLRAGDPGYTFKDHLLNMPELPEKYIPPRQLDEPRVLDL